MIVAVTGAQGQLGRDLVLQFELAGHQVIGLDRKALDITDTEQCKDVFQRLKPDAIIHSAAYTAVDLAETEQDEAYLVNAMGTRNIAAAAEAIGAKCCYISTDYVFDGSSSTPYNEYDPTTPQSIYGKSKRAGEVLLQSLAHRYFIVRTAWVYGLHGNNFVKTMLKLAAEKDRLNVVHDQVGSPTFTEDLARFIVQLVETDKYGIYHATNTGSCSWYEFAKAIFEEKGLSVEIDPCTTSLFPRPAPRPAFSVLDHMAIRTNGFEDLRHWRDGLKEFLQKVHQ